MSKHRHLALIVALLMTASAGAAPADTTELGEPVERHLSGDQTFQRWSQDPDLLDSERGDRLEVQQVVGEELETVKLKDVVPPIRFESGVAQIPPDYVDKLARVLESMRFRRNVRLHFVGHADSQPLSDSLVRVFGDNSGLSRERAGEVAEYFKTALALPPEVITYEWAGDTQPIGSNETEEGRALNRRVEVEVWYDEVRDALRDEEVVVADDIKRIKVCRMETVCKLRYREGHARRARVRNLVVPLRYQDETTSISEEFLKQIRQALYNLRDKQGVTVRFIGYTDDTPLTGRNERIYGNLIVTHAEDGAYYFDEDRLYHVTVPVVKAIDTIGAGDNFHAAFALALAKGFDLHRAVAFSVAVASLSCREYGGRKGVPKMNAALEVADTLADRMIG